MLKFPYLTILLANLLVLYPAVNSWPFWDDSIFFKSGLLSAAEHPLVYWMSGPFNKTWPTGFTVAKVLYSLFGTQYWLYKIQGLLLHAANAGLAFGLLKKFLPASRALLIALLFSLHPMRVESALWIFQLNTLLAAFFLFASAHFFCAQGEGRRKWMWYGLALGSFLLSITSKSLALFFPLLALYYLRRLKKPWGKALLLILPFVLLSFHYGRDAYRGTFSYPNEISHQRHLIPADPAPEEVVEEEVPKKTAVSEVASAYPQEETKKKKDFRPLHLGDKVQLFFEGLSFYGAKSIVPYPLLFMYPQRPFHWSHGAFLCLLIALFFYGRKRRPGASAFFLCWLLAFIPTSGVAYIAYFKFSFVANRYMYIGLLGFAGFLVSLLPALPGPGRWKKLNTSLGVAAILSLAALTVPHAQTFTQPQAIYRHNYRHNPQNIYPLILLTRHYANTGQWEEAMATLDEVVANPHPRFFHPFLSVVQYMFDLKRERWIYLSKWYENLGQRDQALGQLEKALLAHPGDPEIKKRIALLNGELGGG